VARGYRTITLELVKREDAVSVYTSPRVADALEEIVASSTLYEGVRLLQILEAVYEQGRKDGARSVFEELERVKGEIPHANPGRPKKKLRRGGRA
jgi:hypothetical protein